MAKSYKVFYFEDDLKEGQEIKNFLEKEPERPGDPHLEVTHHLTARIAFDVIKQWSGHPPDVALLDVHQKNYSDAGLDISDDIKKTWPRVPVVMLSQLDTLAEQMKGYERARLRTCRTLYVTNRTTYNSYGLSSLPRYGIPREPIPAKARIGTAVSRSTRKFTRYIGARRKSH